MINRRRFTPTGVGKASLVLLKNSQPIGSPPQAWGKRADRPSAQHRATVHPHRRGESGCQGISFWLDTLVHPHRRGESCMVLYAAVPKPGSPPQAWGKLYLQVATGHWETVHPHRRGESFGLSDWPRLDGGSPPQAWGKRAGGFTILLQNTVHPHRRGESAAIFRSVYVRRSPSKRIPVRSDG